MIPHLPLELNTNPDLPKVLFDTNVILDILLAREPYAICSRKVVACMYTLDAKSFVAASAITDLYYLLRKQLGNPASARDALEEVLRLFEVADTTGIDIHNAHAVKNADFEDAVVAAVAARMGLQYLITRNTKDFKDLPVRAVTPSEFLKLMNEEVAEE